MKVLLVSSSSGSRGGGELYLAGLAQGLTQLELTDQGPIEVNVVLASHPRMDDLAEILAPIVPVRRLDFPNTYDRKGRSISGYLDTRTIKRLRDFLNACDADVVHLNKQNSEDAPDWHWAGWRSGKPMVATVHVPHSLAELKAAGGRWRDWMARRLYRKAPCPLIAVSEASGVKLREALQLSATDQTAVWPVPNGVPDAPSISDDRRQQIRNSWKVGPDHIVIGVLARIEAQKNPLFLPKVLTQLPNNARLVWVGDGRLRPQMEALIAELGVGDRVHIDGWQPDAQQRLQAFDIFALPSHFEGLPLAILEAMAARLACVVSAVDGGNEAVIHEQTGLTCPVDDVPGWAEVLSQLCQDSAYRQRLGQAARERYETHYTLGCMAQGTLEVYKQALNAQQKAGQPN